LIEEIATWSRRYGQHPDPSGKKEGKWKGRTENYIQVELEGDHKKGEIISYTFD
jgi:hypothetical protein